MDKLNLSEPTEQRRENYKGEATTMNISFRGLWDSKN
jgi:hypothetical protein